MVQAVTSIEDRRFFEHGGINYARLAKCAFTDIVSGQEELRRLDLDPAARQRTSFSRPKKATSAR